MTRPENLPSQYRSKCHLERSVTCKGSIHPSIQPSKHIATHTLEGHASESVLATIETLELQNQITPYIGRFKVRLHPLLGISEPTTLLIIVS